MSYIGIVISLDDSRLSSPSGNQCIILEISTRIDHDET